MLTQNFEMRVWLIEQQHITWIVVHINQQKKNLQHPTTR